MNSVAYHCHGWLLCLFPIHRPLGFVRHDIACCCVTIRCMCISYRYVLVVVIVRIVGNSRSRLRQFDSVRCQYRILKILKLLISVTYGIKIINNTITTSTLVHDFYTTTTTSNNTDSNTNISVYCRRCHHHPTPTRLIVVMHRTAARHFTAPRRRLRTGSSTEWRRCYFIIDVTVSVVGSAPYCIPRPHHRHLIVSTTSIKQEFLTRHIPFLFDDKNFGSARPNVTS